MTDRTSPPGTGLSRWRGVFFNVACAIYFVTLAPLVIDRASFAMRSESGTVLWLGFLIIAISLGEIYALPLKTRFVREAAAARGDVLPRGFLLWMFHSVISILLTFLIASCFGFRLTEGEDTPLPWWLGTLIVLVVIKELGFLFLFLSSPDEDEAAERKPEFSRPSRKEWIADFILIVYACVAWSATWGAIVEDLSMERDNPPMFILNLFVSSLLFLIFYLPLRIPFLLEELSQIKSAADTWKFIGSILLVLIPVILMLT